MRRSPDNVSFDVGDINVSSDWEFEESFDLVHIQRIFAMVTDWEQVCKSAYELKSYFPSKSH